MGKTSTASAGVSGFDVVARASILVWTLGVLMKWPSTVFCVAFLTAVGFCCMAESVSVPDPVLVLDFDSAAAGAPRAALAEGQGIAGTRCISALSPKASGKATPFVLSSPELLAALDGAWSFTITGWINRRVNMRDEDTTNQCVVSCPGRFKVICDGTYGWRLAMDVHAGEKSARAWSTWLADFYPNNRWVFFAVSYDGTKSEGKYTIYSGHEQYPVKEDASGPIALGQLNGLPGGPLIVGASSPDGNEPFKGLIDSVRIYATRKKSSECALDWQQLDQVRRSDLGQAWLDRVAAEKIRAVRAEEDRLRSVESANWSKPLNLHQVDGLERVFPDRPPTPSSDQTVSVPRGGSVAVSFAGFARGMSESKFSFELGPIRSAGGESLTCSAKIYEVVDVPVEANNNGGMRTSVKTKPPPMWAEDFVRTAPFRACEVLVESDSVVLGGASPSYKSILVDISLSPQANPGVYRGALRLKSADASVSAPFAIEVHKTHAPAEPSLRTHYWLSPDPVDLTTGPAPGWWSEEHWRLLENAGRTLRDYGQDTLWTPLIGGAHPLIQTARGEDGSYSFDFDRFDRWMETFLKLGYKRMAGQQILSMPGRRGIVVIDSKTGKLESLFGGPEQEDAWIEFIPVFFDSLHRHLRRKGWVGVYAQHLYDEPNNLDKYKKLSSILRKHMPGVVSIDAIKTKPEYSPLVDIHVFDVFLIYPRAQRLAAERRSRGQESWLYHCCSPYPPYPNRHLDERLSGSRLYPWLCYLVNADGYLYWAANMYRGADPYKTSVGPLPNGSQDPGHPPGDNWMFYPGPDGLRGTMRMMAFRDGLLDHALLSRLAERDKAMADGIMKMVATDMVDYARDPASFHVARKALLRALDSLD